MFKFLKQIFISTMIFFGNLTNVNSLECISIKNQECKVRPEIININSSNPIFYPFNIKINRCNGNCNNINDPYWRICIPDIVKNLNLKVFNLMSRTNEANSIEWHESCKCICRLNAIVCNNKQQWNKNKCRCEILMTLMTLTIRHVFEENGKLYPRVFLDDTLYELWKC